MVIGILIALLCVIVAGGAGFMAYKNKKMRKTSKIATIVPPCIIVFMVIIFLIVPFSIRTVKAGEVAVVKFLGEARETRTAGTYFDLWITQKYDVYDAKVQTLELVAPSYSNDKQTMDITMTVQYQIQTDRVKDIAINYGSLEQLNNRLQSVVLEKTKSELSKYNADQLIQDRATISPEVTTVISNALAQNYYVNILTVSLVNIDFSDAYEQSVEQTMITEQENIKAAAEAKKKLIEAENKIAVAEKEAAAKAAEAEGEAEAIRIKAEAEAEAIKIKSLEVASMLGLTIVDSQGNEVIKPNLTVDEAKLISEYLRYIEYLSKWDGKLPEVLTDGDSSVMITAPGNSGN